MTKKHPSHRSSPSQLRIIGGQWRSRRLPIVDNPGLRPTPDRVRETLFNWLAPTIIGARCLDAFAGTGALGLEALSRGAGEVVFVERDRLLANAITQHLNTLGGNGRVVCGEFGAASVHAMFFDIAFLDPPFNGGHLEPALATLEPHLAPGHSVYLEYARGNAPELTANWTLLKEKHAGQVSYALATYSADGKDNAA